MGKKKTPFNISKERAKQYHDAVKAFNYKRGGAVRSFNKKYANEQKALSDREKSRQKVAFIPYKRSYRLDTFKTKEEFNKAMRALQNPNAYEKARGQLIRDYKANLITAKATKAERSNHGYDENVLSDYIDEIEGMSFDELQAGLMSGDIETVTEIYEGTDGDTQ